MFVKRRDWEEVWKRLEALEGLETQVQELGRDVQNFHLDYNNLYEKVRTNLAKLRKRVDRDENGDSQPADPTHKWRQMLLQKKMGG